MPLITEANLPRLALLRAANLVDAGWEHQEDAVQWNDAPGRRKEEVVALLREVASGCPTKRPASEVANS